MTARSIDKRIVYPLATVLGETVCVGPSSFVVEQGFQNDEQLPFFKTHMGRQSFGKSQHRRGIGLLQLSAEVPQFRVIAHDALDEPALAGGSEQWQQNIFLNGKMGIKLAGERRTAGCRRRFDRRRVSARRGAPGLQCQLQRMMVFT